MRTRTAILTGALLLASSGLAPAQQQAQSPTTAQAQQAPAAVPSTFTPKFGQFDFGFRADSTDGDEARFNRYQDLRQGAFLERFHFQREESTWFFRAEADNVGYRDQRYFADYQKIGRLKARFEFNQIPLFSTGDQHSLFEDDGNGYLPVDDAIQQNIQAASLLGTPARDTAISTAISQANSIDVRSKRSVASVGLVYSFNRDVDFKFNLRNSNRSGNQIISYGFGTSPGLNPSLEVPTPMEDRTTDVNAVVEFANAKGLLSVGYNGSWYDQSNAFVKFDNPLRAIDAPIVGSTGGASIGQAALWPTNSAYSFIANGSYTIAPRTRASLGLSLGKWSQDAALPPMTVNTALPSSPIERRSAETEADITSVVFNLNSRPTDAVWLNARYRYYDYDNKTPHFTATNAIIGDWNVTTQVHEIEPPSLQRKTLDLDASFTPLTYASFSAGYSREDGHRTYRIFEETAEDVFRVSVDSTGNQYVTLRLKYEKSNREGSGFEEHLLDEVGEHREMRHYDIANRDRDRTTFMVMLTPMSQFGINASVSAGTDDYSDTGFGLRDSKNTAWSIGFDAAPMDTVNVSLSYGWDEYKANSYSRTASPAPDPTFDDPTRDWWTDQNDTVKTFTVNLDFPKAIPKSDLRLSYDLSDGRATYVYSMKPEQKVFTTIPLTQLSAVENRLTGFRADFQHFVRPNVALGLAYWYNDYAVDDFALGPQTINQLDPKNGTTGVFANTIYAGYLYRPYTAHTTWLRMTYLW